MKKTLFLLMALPLYSLSQQGMKFEHGLSWKDIQAKAKTENKYIFMDAFTTWCGPCRYMAENIFPMEKVGNFFNDKFINVKVQLDTTQNDNDEVKSWYADGHDIMKKYKVQAFPTYLFFSPEGKLVHRSVGSSEADKFIAKAADALNPAKQYYVLLDQYKAGKKDPDFLRNVAYSSQEAYDIENANTVSKEYLATQKNLFTKENLEFIDRFTNTSNDAGFALIMKNPAKFDEVRGAGASQRKISDIIKREELLPVIFKRDAPAPDWTKLSATINTKYPGYAKEAVSGGKAMYYQMKGDWANFQTAVLAYMKDYGDKVSAGELNNFAWTVFENCKDMTCVKEALEWSKKSFKDNNNPMFIDTYANILYKLGNKEEAIKWEEKALGLANNDKAI
ncbi:MAG TPA: thioredoxin fold domain-containing protein, partial [Segetibacter sp.]|nr:thioredoxin fold domain-containing protein [Segetibacter sp.]